MIYILHQIYYILYTSIYSCIHLSIYSNLHMCETHEILKTAEILASPDMQDTLELYIYIHISIYRNIHIFIYPYIHTSYPYIHRWHPWNTCNPWDTLNPWYTFHTRYIIYYIHPYIHISINPYMLPVISQSSIYKKKVKEHNPTMNIIENRDNWNLL